jgi:hypothetical protein
MRSRAELIRRRSGVGRFFRFVGLALVLAMLVPTVIGWTRGAIQCQMLGGGAPAEQSASPPGSGARPEEQTYLTLPEWYIVYSADEYAAFLAKSPPSQFPYFQAVGQFWQAYYDVCTVTRDRYPFNSGTQLMLAVIGTSFTAENVFKGIYENTIGRAAEWTSTGQQTPEEVYGRTVAAEYGTFLHTTPWYEFPFWGKIGPLWKTMPSGSNVVRQVERRLALTIEYGVKAGYGWAIKQGTESVYSPEDMEIVARAEGVTPDLVAREPGLRIVQEADGQLQVVMLPRYEAFTLIVPRLVDQDVRFVEIAGNDEIMLTILAPRNWKPGPENGELLFAMPILTEPDRARLAVKTTVTSLHTVVGDLTRRAASDNVKLEHVYDY